MDDLISTLTTFLRYCTIGLFGLYAFFGVKFAIFIADKIAVLILKKKMKNNKADGDIKNEK